MYEGNGSERKGGWRMGGKESGKQETRGIALVRRKERGDEEEEGGRKRKEGSTHTHTRRGKG